MNKILILVVMAGMVVAMAGCQGGAKTKEPAAAGVKLPPEVAGIWEEVVEDGIPWAMVITEDGKLEEARLALAAAIVRPNETVKIKMRDGQYSTFRTGPAYVVYEPQTRELTVAFDVPELEVLYLEDRLVGSAKYAFTGPVSEDGKNWTTIFSEEFDYGPRFPLDPNGIGVPMNFKKAEPHEH